MALSQTKRRRKGGDENTLVLWTHDATQHRDLLEQVSEWMPEDERAKGRCADGSSKRWAPREWAGTPASMCRKTTTTNGTFTRAWSTTQFALERRCDDLGWTFEAHTAVPASSDAIPTLAGNAPIASTPGSDGGRKARNPARNEFIKEWRAMHAQNQNDHLKDCGATKRYRPRFYRDQGRSNQVPGQHRGTVASTVECRGDDT